MDFEEIFKELITQVIALANTTAQDYTAQAKEDANQFLETSKIKLKDWTSALANGQIDKDEFKWLMNSQKSLAQMKSLTQVGLAKAKVDKFRQGVLNMVIDVVFDKVL